MIVLLLSSSVLFLSRFGNVSCEVFEPYLSFPAPLNDYDECFTVNTVRVHYTDMMRWSLVHSSGPLEEAIKELEYKNLEDGFNSGDEVKNTRRVTNNNHDELYTMLPN
jgi:hypothetical protein